MGSKVRKKLNEMFSFYVRDYCNPRVFKNTKRTLLSIQRPTRGKTELKYFAKTLAEKHEIQGNLVQR